MIQSFIFHGQRLDIPRKLQANRSDFVFPYTSAANWSSEINVQESLAPVERGDCLLLEGLELSLPRPQLQHLHVITINQASHSEISPDKP
jgi:hypothetical protein